MQQLLFGVLFTLFTIVAVSDTITEKTVVVEEPFDPDIFYVRVLKAAAESRIVVDKEGKILYAARIAAEITGYGQKELEGMDAQELIPARYRPGHNTAMKRALGKNSDEVGSVRCHLLRKDGSEIFVEIRTRTVIENGERVILTTLTPVAQIEEIPTNTAI